MHDVSVPDEWALLRTLRTQRDDQVLRGLKEALRHSRQSEWVLVAHIGEVDERRLYAPEGWKSMFLYCVEHLHLSKAEAYLRIEVARAAREHPVLLTMLGDGRLHLSGIATLIPHLTAANGDALLARATHKTKEQIKELIAEIAPKPDVPSRVRKLPESRAAAQGGAPIGNAPALNSEVRPTKAPAATSAELRPDGVPSGGTPEPAPSPSPARRAVVEPLSPGRYAFHFTGDAAFRDKLERLAALMRRAVPNGDLAAILDIAVTEKLERLEARKFGRTKRPRKELETSDTSATGSRYLPAASRRATDERDEGRCRYVNDRGQRCSARVGIEFHHVHAHGRGGDRSPQNLRQMCRTHNAYLADLEYGRRWMSKYRRKPCRAGGAATQPALDSS